MLNKKEVFKKIYRTTSGLLDPQNKRKMPFSRSIQKFLISQARSNFTKINGNKMCLDKKDSLNFSLNGMWEEMETEFVKNVVKKDDVVLDIGANIGYYTLLFAKLVGKKGQVFSFEPEPENLMLLKKNIVLNNYQNITLETKALSNEDKKTKLYFSNGNIGQHRIYPSIYTKDNFIEIESMKLDTYFKNNSLKEKISFVKMDVEGWEFNVLQGMKTILQNKKIQIMLEFIPFCIKEAGSDPLTMLDFLTNFGFDIHIINKERRKIERVKNIPKLIDTVYGNGSLKDLREVTIICKK